VTEEQFNSVFNQSAAAGATAGDRQQLEPATTPEAPAAANDNKPAVSVNLADENGQAQEQKEQPDTQPEETTTLSEHGPPPLPSKDNIPPTEGLAPTGTE
jgi:hypothetical protein